MIKYQKEEILTAINIIDLTNQLSISLEQINSGNFTHRCRCPSKEHKNGSERTGSLYIDCNNNNFYCFGCGASNNVIDFYILCKDVDFSTALSELSELVDPTKVGKAVRQNKIINFSQLLELSNLFRTTQKAHPEDSEWIEEFMKKTDKFLEGIDRYDVKRAKALLEKAKRLVRRRYSDK